MSDLLAIENLSAGYGEATVLSGVSLSIPQGQALALLGRNGMGKTTLINTIVGATRYRGGSIVLDGQDLTQAALRSARRRRRRLGAAGAQYLQVADRRGEHHRGRAARPLGPRQDLCAVSAPEGAPPQSRQSIVRRRAADARDRPRARAQSAHHAAGRAARGPGPDPDRGIAGGLAPHHPRGGRFGARWSSRMRRKSSASPTVPSSSSAAWSCTRATAPRSRRTAPSSKPISASPPPARGAECRSTENSLILSVGRSQLGRNGDKYSVFRLTSSCVLASL